MKYLEGKKTYIICGVTIVWAWSGVALGMHDVQTAINLTLAALGGAGLRVAK